MPAPSFRPDEIKLLTGHIPEWLKLKKTPTNQRARKITQQQRTELISQLVTSLLRTFPNRDPSVSDPSSTTYTQTELNRLPEVLSQWFRNRTRTPGGRIIIKRQRTKGRTHTRNLAAQRYKQQIGEIACKLRADDGSLPQLTAFNNATTQYLEELKDDDPEALEKLMADAIAIREAAALDYADLSPEALARLLGDFPKRLLAEMEEHGRALPVHIWCITAFAMPPNQEVETWTVTTQSVGAIHGSPAHITMRDEFKAWLTANLGLAANGQIDSAVPVVYPDSRRGLWPRIPFEADLSKVTAQQLRSWLRIFFNYQLLWQGGRGSVPWKALREDREFKYVSKECIPGGLTGLIDPSDMNRHELELWCTWIINGQEGRLQPQQIFQFALIERGDKRPALYFKEPIISRPVESNLTWSPDEKLYAMKVKQNNEAALSNPDWLQLPLA